MNSNNFADWEITKMLPKHYSEFDMRICSDGKFRKSSEDGEIKEWCKSQDEECWKCFLDENVLHPYTWEDIRLYLLFKNIIIVVDIFRQTKGVDAFDDIVLSYCFDVHYSNSTRFIDSPCTMYPTYEEARKEAIIFTLNLINNGK